MRSSLVLLAAVMLLAAGASAHTDHKTHHEHKHDSAATEAVHNAVHFDDAEPAMPGGGATGAHADGDEADEHSDMPMADVTPLTEAEVAVYAQKLESYLQAKCDASTPEARAAFGVCDAANCTAPAYPQWPRASCLIHEQNVTMAEVTAELKSVLGLYGVETLMELDEIEAAEEAELADEEAAFYAEPGHEGLENPHHFDDAEHAGAAHGTDQEHTGSTGAAGTAKSA